MNMKVVDNIAYIATSKGLIIYDISDPLSFTYLGNYTISGTFLVFSVTIYSEENLALLTTTNGILFVDISSSSSPSLVAEWPTLGIAQSVILAGCYAIIAQEDQGFEIIDIASMDNIFSVGSLRNTTGYTTDLVLLGTTLYAAVDTGGLEIFSVANFSSPQFLGKYYPGLGVSKFYIYNIAY